jgi:hypothetical protein
MAPATSHPFDREALRDDLLSAARRHVPAWTGGNDSDPGVLLLELFGWLAEALTHETPLQVQRRLGALVHHLRSGADTVVTVDGVLWRPAGASAHGPEERTYVLERTGDGAVTLRFGDGERGKRPPAGSEVVVSVWSRGGSGTLTTRWPPSSKFRMITASIREDGLSLRLERPAAAAE